MPEKELCLNRLPVEYQPDAPAPTKWLEFLDGLLIPEDILTLQEYLGYLLIPSTKAQKMLVMTGKGGEGKSRIGLLLKKLFGEASHSESILRIETNRFASANLEYKLVMVDDDLNMVALPETRNIKSIVTAEDRLCIERKNKQAVQGLLYVRFICFGNGNLVAAHDDSDGFWRRQILITVKDRDPARVDNPFLIEELSEERPGILLWMLEGLHRLLANRYQFTISERSIQNLEAAMADSDNLTQFMQATAYVRFKPDTEERSTYLYRAYTKWCEDNLESPVPQKKFSQFLLKNAGKYGLTFSKHIEGKFAFVKRSETMKSPVGTLSDRTFLRKQDGGALPRQVLRLPGRMRPPRLCCGIKHTKSENLPPYAPQNICFYLLSLFSPGACLPLPGGCRAAKRPSGRERNQDAPQKGASIPAMRPIKSTQKGTFVWFGARGARKFKFSHFFGLLLRVRSGRPLHIYRPTGCSSTGAAPGLEKCKGDMPMTNVRKNSAKLTREDLKIAPESPTMERQELAVPCEFSVRNSLVISDETSDQTPAVEPSDQTSKTVRHAPLVYRVEEIAQLLAISNRAAYNLCNTTKDFKVIRLGTSIRVSKQSFDDWFAAV